MDFSSGRPEGYEIVVDRYVARQDAVDVSFQFAYWLAITGDGRAFYSHFLWQGSRHGPCNSDVDLSRSHEMKYFVRLSSPSVDQWGGGRNSPLPPALHRIG